MPESFPPTIVCTRGSALALAQANRVLADLRTLHPGRHFELKIVKTTGDRLQAHRPEEDPASISRGLFTKELEEELLGGGAHIAVHSLKDLPTQLPEGLRLAATPIRQDAREVLLTRGQVLDVNRTETEWSPGRRTPYFGTQGSKLNSLPKGAIVATSSPRRLAQLRYFRPDLEFITIRGNVGTRLQKLAKTTAFDATILAIAGLLRLNMDISPRNELRLNPRLTATIRAQLESPPEGVMAEWFEIEEMLPAVGQGAIGLEIREDDSVTAELCYPLNHVNTFAAVQAERAFLAAMGGGCQTPVAAFAKVVGHQLYLRAASFVSGTAQFAEDRRIVREGEALGKAVATRLLDQGNHSQTGSERTP